MTTGFVEITVERCGYCTMCVLRNVRMFDRIIAYVFRLSLDGPRCILKRKNVRISYRICYIVLYVWIAVPFSDLGLLKIILIVYVFFFFCNDIFCYRRDEKYCKWFRNLYPIINKVSRYYYCISCWILYVLIVHYVYFTLNLTNSHKKITLKSLLLVLSFWPKCKCTYYTTNYSYFNT